MDIDTTTTRLLDRAGLGNPLIWAGIRVDRNGLALMIGSMGLLDGKDPAETTALLDLCERLQAVAKGVGEAWVDQHAGLSDVQLSLDETLAKRAKREETEA